MSDERDVVGDRSVEWTRAEGPGWTDPGEDLAAWLLEQIAELEQRAQAAVDGATKWRRGEFPAECGIVDDQGEIIVYDEGRPSADQADHIATWDPARVMAECDAKRQIISAYQRNFAKANELRRKGEDSRPLQTICLTLHWTIKRLALPMADRPGYREDWRP